MKYEHLFNKIIDEASVDNETMLYSQIDVCEEELFEYTDFFVSTIDKNLRSYQRMVLAMNLSRKLRALYFEQLSYLDPEFMNDIGDVYHIGESFGWERFIRYLKYRSNPIPISKILIWED